MEIYAGLLLSLCAAVVGVWQVTRRDRPIHGPRDDGTLGLPHLQRWSDSYKPPKFERLRRAAPRFQVSGVILVAIAVTVVVLAGALVLNQLNRRADSSAAGIEARLQTIAAVRLQAESATTSQAAFASLSEAQSALDGIDRSAATDELQERIVEEEHALSTAISELTRTEQITNVQVMGSLPPTPEGVTARLFKGGERIFVLAGGFFELDQVSGTLIQLLEEGDNVGGSPVGPLLAAGWNEDRPLVVDALNAYLLDPATGQWHRVPLGVLSTDGYSDITAAAVFNRNIYFLSAESGLILRFDALDFSAPPEDWAAGSARDYLHNGVDLIVDGSIHVALRDGTVLSFFRSALETTRTVEVIPPLESVTSLSTIADGAYFMLVNGSDGRIVGIDQEGSVVRQFVTAPGAPSLAGATDMAMNETNGIAYVIAGDTLYAVRLSMPTQ